MYSRHNRQQIVFVIFCLLSIVVGVVVTLLSIIAVPRTQKQDATLNITATAGAQIADTATPTEMPILAPSSTPSPTPTARPTAVQTWSLPTPASISDCVQDLAADRFGFPPPIIPEGLGVNIHYAKGPEDGLAQYAMVAEAGFRFVRDDMRWEVVETVKGQYDFEDYDRYMERLTQAGLRALFILKYSNLLYESNPRSIRTEEGRQAFAAFAAAAARRYAGQGVVWEIWNEPNNAGFWPPEPNVDEYFEMLITTVSAIRRADPKAVIVAPATGLDWAYLEALFEKGMLEYVDGVSVHPYQFLDPPEGVVSGYDKLRNLIARYAPPEKSIPIVSSEWGYSSVTHDLRDVEDLQARYLPRQFLVNIWQNIPIQAWFIWRRPGGEPETPKYAIVTPDGTPTKAYYAAKTLMSTLDGYRFVQRLPMKSEQDYVLLFSNCRQYALAVWTAPPGVNLGPPAQHKVVLPLPAGRGWIISMLGDKREITWSDSGLEIMLSEEPHYVLLESLSH